MKFSSEVNTSTRRNFKWSLLKLKISEFFRVIFEINFTVNLTRESC